MAWQISDEQWARLERVWRGRLPPRLTGGHLASLIMIWTFSTVAIESLLEGYGRLMPYATGVAAAGTALLAFWWRGRTWRAWRRTFKPERRSGRRLLVEIPGRAEDALLTYQCMRALPNWQWLTMKMGAPAGLMLQPKATPLGEPDFDRVLGITGSPVARALVGHQLRTHAAAWHTQGKFSISDGVARLQIGPAGFEDLPTIQRIAKAVGEYADRLSAPPTEALAQMALDTTHPFDATRALLALLDQWPADAERICDRLRQTPVGEAMVHIARTGEGIMHPALDWPTRSAIVRGALDGPASIRATLHAWFDAANPIDGSMAMALVDMCEYADASSPRARLAETVNLALDVVAEMGNPDALRWMRARGATDRRSKARLLALGTHLVQVHGDHPPDQSAAGAQPTPNVPVAADRTVAEPGSVAWPIDDAQWEILAHARATRPRQLYGARALLVLAPGTLVAALAVAMQESTVAWTTFLGTLLVTGLVASHPARRWRRQFRARDAKKNRQVVDISGSKSAPRLEYQRLETKPDWEWLTLQTDGLVDVSVRPSAPAIGDRAFDQHLGFAGRPIQRALIGPSLREHAAQWHTQAGFLISGGKAKVKLGEHGYDDRETLQAIATAFGDFSDRLSAPEAGLTQLAQDLAHPFDAARALATLHAHWPDAAATVCAAIADAPIGPTLARVATTGDGILDTHLDWPTRSAIGRGVLGAEHVARQTLALQLETYAVTDGASAMALVELCEAGAVLLERPSFTTSADLALGVVISHGGPECLAWLRDRAPHDHASQVALQRLSARLQSEHGGLLSLDASAHAGALSETYAGELSIASETPPA